MKKYILVWTLILLPGMLLAQKFTNADRVRISARIDSLLLNYMQKGVLSDQPNMKRRNEKMFREYKSLFALDAMVFDDINAKFDSKAKDFPYKLEVKSRLDYFDGLAEAFEEGLVIINKRININYDNLDDRIVKVALERQIEGTTYQGYQLRNDDTLLLTLAIQPDNSVKIKIVDKLGSHLRVLNDKDLDGVIDTKDECIDERGLSYLGGCPDSDNDGIADKKDACKDLAGPADNDGCPASTFSYSDIFSASIGYHLNQNKIEMPELIAEDLSYTGLNKSKSEQGEINANHTFKGGLVFAANIAHYFGKKQNKNKGVSLGILFSNYSEEYKVSGTKYYFTDNQNNDPIVQEHYRSVSLVNCTEKLAFNILNVPLQLKLKRKLGQKFAFEFGAGVNFTYQKTKYAVDSKFNLGSRYTYTGYPDEKNDLILLEEGELNYSMFGANAEDFATLIPEYKVGETNYSVEKTSINNNRWGLGGIASADLFYHATSKIAIKLGAVYLFTNMKSNKNKSYMPIEINSTTNDGTYYTYNSIFNSNQTNKYRSFGLNIGFIIGI